MNSVLLVDDDPVFQSVAAETLRAAGYKVSTASAGPECLALTRKQSFDLLVLDLVMPGLSGVEVCEALKKDARTMSIPILILTGNKKEGQEVTCLDHGADDYMTKPVDWKLLLARSRALLRRAVLRARRKSPLSIGGVELDYSAKTVTIHGKTRGDLAPKEFELLYELASRSPSPCSKEDLYRQVWGGEPPSPSSLKTVAVHVRRVREKLGLKAGAGLGHVAGRGYRFKPPRAKTAARR